MRYGQREIDGSLLHASYPSPYSLCYDEDNLFLYVGDNKTKNMIPITKDNYSGRYIHYGIREHAMAAVMNGLSLHGGIRPYGGTFLVFTDYCRPSIRLAALMKLPIIYVMTHDSIGLGEDGPTHQPVEHLASLRAMPNLNVIRPCDIIETIEAWEVAIRSSSTPTVLVLTRQNLPMIRNKDEKQNILQFGAYAIIDYENYHATVLATGSEVEIAVEAAKHLVKDKIYVISQNYTTSLYFFVKVTLEGD